MNTPRLADLREPPVVGKFYLVPFIRAKWFHYEADWPVYGPLHEDAKHFDFKHLHYHIDPRFIPQRVIDAKDWRRVFGSPISFGDAQLNPPPPKGRPREKRMKCKRIVHPTLRAVAPMDNASINTMQADYGLPHIALEAQNADAARAALAKAPR